MRGLDDATSKDDDTTVDGRGGNRGTSLGREHRVGEASPAIKYQRAAVRFWLPVPSESVP
jgi:hypothetical protein